MPLALCACNTIYPYKQTIYSSIPALFPFPERAITAEGKMSYRKESCQCACICAEGTSHCRHSLPCCYSSSHRASISLPKRLCFLLMEARMSEGERRRGRTGNGQTMVRENVPLFPSLATDFSGTES